VMAKLTTKTRDKLPKSDFAGPGRSYPVEDKAHARAAKSRASGSVNAGRMSKSEERKIDAAADRVLRGKRK
jgi:hypothetical protein